MPLVSAPAVAEPAPPEQHEIIPAEGPFAGFVREAAQRFGVPAPWIEAVMRAESAGDTRAVSPKGAMGLMQIMPATWAELRARYDLGADPYDPRDNILAGAAYLREMHDRFGSPGFLAAYHAGPRRYEEHLQEGRPLPGETRDYIAAVAPIIGVGADAPVLTAALDSEAWMRAPLFVARAGAGAEARRESSPRDRTTADPSALAPQTADLFVRNRAEAASP
jgi:soluble lytic murein transglycosylase-like protein